jgi:ubiquinone/menaquinone biosynthesis C-methylase UbiE
MKAEDVENYALAEFVLAEERNYAKELERLRVDLSRLKILDLAAGPGTWTKLFAEAGSPFVVWSDRSVLFLTYARRYLAHLEAPRGSIRYVVSDFCAIPFAEASFDMVFCRLSLHHASDELAALREIYRVLRPCGVLALYAHTVGRVKDATMPKFKKLAHYTIPVISELLGKKPVSTLFHIRPLLLRKVLKAGFIVETIQEIDSGVAYFHLRKPALQQTAPFLESDTTSQEKSALEKPGGLRANTR